MRRRLALAILYAIAAIACLAADKPERVIRVGSAGFEMAPSIVAKEILVEAYDRIGYRADFPVYPPNRMIALMKSGELDALILAEASFSDEYPGSIRVGTVIWNDELVAFTKIPLQIRGWESLKPYRVGFFSGMLIIQKKLAVGYETFPVGDPNQLFRMLEAGRTDVVVTSRALGELLIATLGLQDIARSGEVLEIVPVYHYLSKKNADVARRLSIALEEMERSGRIAEITDATLARLFPNTRN